MENENKNDLNIETGGVIEQPKINQDINKKQIETTYEDVFANLSKRVKDKEVFETVKKGYEKQLASSIAKNKVLDVEVSLLNEYSETKAEILSEKKLEERINAKMQEFENEAKSYFQKNGQELTQEDLDDLIAYKIVDNHEELELVKQNPLLAKRTIETLTITKSKNQPLPKVNVSREQSNISEEKFKEIQKKIVTRNATEEERNLFNQNLKFFIK